MQVQDYRQTNFYQSSMEIIYLNTPINNKRQTLFIIIIILGLCHLSPILLCYFVSYLIHIHCNKISFQFVDRPTTCLIAQIKWNNIAYSVVWFEENPRVNGSQTNQGEVLDNSCYITSALITFVLKITLLYFCNSSNLAHLASQLTIYLYFSSPTISYLVLFQPSKILILQQSILESQKHLCQQL